MKIHDLQADDIILAELGARITQRRIELGLSQADLAEQAGIGKRTLERIEAGATSQTTTLVRVLRGLKMLERLDAMIPESGPSPMDLLKLKGKTRKRAPRARQKPANKSWTWEGEA
jgi:transcriptional regulator with XRE-family HTH domain